MKRICLILLCLGMLFSFCACGGKSGGEETQAQAGYKVSNPMKYPVYQVSESPTTDELRETAIKAMRDMLTIQWSANKFYAYQKTGAVSEKQYSYVPEVTFAGLPYTNGDSNIYTWMEYYDQETGMLNFDGDGAALNDTLGNTCTGSLMYGWAAVCHSLDGLYDNFHMVQKHGCIPLGGITYPYEVETFQQYSTKKIIEENGKDKILEAYALVKKADGLTSEPEDHGMMAIEDAHVVRNDSGVINLEESYIMIQDQRAGEGDYFYEVEENGETLLYHGRTSYKCTFAYLFNKSYIPVTTAEFLGQVPYEKPSVKYTGPETSLKEILQSGKLTCNYPMSIVKFILIDDKGEETLLYRQFLNKRDIYSGAARDYALDKLNPLINDELIAEKTGSGGNYTVRLDVTVTNGEVFTPVKAPLK